MNNKKDQLILDGNALYEIDSECVWKKEKAIQEQRRREEENRRKTEDK